MKTEIVRFVLTIVCVFALPILVGHAQTGTMTKIDASPVMIKDGKVDLSPDTTMIEFVGTHVGDDPKPRVGGFKAFKGQIEMADQNAGIKSMNLEIDINSLWTEFTKLTNHLKNADFFESDKFGGAKFKSTKIGKDDGGNTTITGELTLHGQTKEVSFPAKVKVSDQGLMMMSEFKLDRSLFGMDQMTSGVEKTVSLQMVVGQKTATRNAMSGPGTKKKKEGSEKKGSEKKGSETKPPQSVSISAPNMT